MSDEANHNLEPQANLTAARMRRWGTALLAVWTVLFLAAAFDGIRGVMAGYTPLTDVVIGLSVGAAFIALAVCYRAGQRWAATGVGIGGLAIAGFGLMPIAAAALGQRGLSNPALWKSIAPVLITALALAALHWACAWAGRAR